MPHPKVRRNRVNGLSPTVFLVVRQWCVVAFLCLPLVPHVKVPIPFRFLTVLVVAIFELVESMLFLEWIVIFSEDGHVVGVGAGGHEVCEFGMRIGQ